MFIKIKNSFWSVLPSRKSYYPKTMAWSQHIMRTASLSSRGFDSRDAGEPDFFPSPSPPPLSPSDFERSTYPNWTATPSARLESGHSVVEVTVFGESFFFFLIGGKLFYSVGLVSAIQQSESAISILMPPLSWTPSQPPGKPTPLGHHRARVELPVLCSIFPLPTYFTHGGIHMSVLFGESY